VILVSNEAAVQIMLEAPKAELALRAHRAEKEHVACQHASAAGFSDKHAELRERCAQLQQRVTTFEELRKLDAADLTIKVCMPYCPQIFRCQDDLEGP
jgi:hypothetical protein